MHQMLFSGVYGYAIFSCSVIIFISYQSIPSGLRVIEEHGRNTEKSLFLVSVTSSPMFRAFIRFCGVNHLIMSGVMLATANHVIMVEPIWQALLLAGEGIVAFVSFMSASAVWRVKWFLQKQQ